MTRPENQRAIGKLLSLRYSVQRGWCTDWPEPQVEFIPIPDWCRGGLKEVSEC